MPWKRGRCSWVLLGSGLSDEQRTILRGFALLTGAKLCQSWGSSITHVVCGVDTDGCVR